MIGFLLKGLKKVKAQGIGVHKPEEILEFGKQDLKVLSELLADKPFFFGDEPTTVSIYVKVIRYLSKWIASSDEGQIGNVTIIGSVNHL